MKKIGIDARLYSQTGIGTYLKNLLYYLEKKELTGELYYVYMMPEDYDRVLFKNNKIIKRKVNYQWHGIGEQFGFAITLYFDNLDLMHFTYFSYPILYLKKFVATIHDTTPLLFKTGKASTKNKLIYNIKHAFFKIILKQQVIKALRIITPTNTVRKQLISLYGEKISKKTIPIHEGISYQIRQAKENKLLSKKFNNFFTYVGNFYPHKNVEKLIDAFSKIKTTSKLILLGPDDYFSNRIFQCIDISKSDDRIFLIKNPSLQDLVFFYKNALALIHPSLSEGFGLPLIEAAYFNCPIIASDIGVFKELLGNNYLSFNPNDINDITKKIKEFIEKKPDFNYKNILEKYSFEKMADETVKIYRRILYHEK